MKRRYLLEISVETLEAALAAQRGGADRIELCGNLSIGGVTPSIEVMRTVREQLHIPIFAIIRPRGGNFVYSGGEAAQIKRSIGEAKQAGMDGVVAGVLTSDGSVDMERTRELVALARPLPLTFHRAFDDCRDLRRALEEVIPTGASRILTSGGAKSAPEGAAILAELIAAAGNRITIVPGAGISASNIAMVVRETGAREFHSGLGSVLPYGSHDYQRFETEVRKLSEQLASLP
ncbi:MAG: copper homeostasis protein CutC [Candidatus Acidiferrum sp.]